MHAYARKLDRENAILTFLCPVFFLEASYHRDARIYENDTDIYESTEYRDLYTHVYNVYTIHMYLRMYVRPTKGRQAQSYTSSVESSCGSSYSKINRASSTIFFVLNVDQKFVDLTR